MSLQKIVESTISDLRSKKLPIGAYLATRAADGVATIFNVYKYGPSIEWNPDVRYFLESFGPIKGMLDSNAIYTPPIFLGLYISGKALGWVLRPKAVSTKRFLEHFPFYFAASLNTFCAISNVVVYFGGPSPF